MKKGCLFIISAPSGAGKGTIINYLLSQNLNLEFAISATSRPPRGEEQNGREYFFLTKEEFKTKLANDEFLEYEEVYEGRYYGTLKSEVDRIINAGKNIIFDLDVLGACQLKDYFGDKALSIFIQPPSVSALRKRLEERGTETAELIEARMARAEYELSFAPRYDVVLINDDLDIAKSKAVSIIEDYIKE